MVLALAFPYNMDLLVWHLAFASLAFGSIAIWHLAFGIAPRLPSTVLLLTSTPTPCIVVQLSFFLVEQHGNGNEKILEAA